MDRPEFHRLAERELNEAAQYYDLENRGLGSSFLQEVYALLYKVKPSGIRILAVMNLARRPGWDASDAAAATQLLLKRA